LARQAVRLHAPQRGAGDGVLPDSRQPAGGAGVAGGDLGRLRAAGPRGSCSSRGSGFSRQLLPGPGEGLAAEAAPTNSAKRAGQAIRARKGMAKPRIVPISTATLSPPAASDDP